MYFVFCITNLFDDKWSCHTTSFKLFILCLHTPFWMHQATTWGNLKTKLRIVLGTHQTLLSSSCATLNWKTIKRNSLLTVKDTGTSYAIFNLRSSQRVIQLSCVFCRNIQAANNLPFMMKNQKTRFVHQSSPITSTGFN